MGHPREWAIRLIQFGIGVCLLVALMPEASAGDGDASVEGLVVDPLGRPVGGAKVMLVVVDSTRWSARESPETIKRFFHAPKRAEVRTVTDGKGRFRVGGLRPDTAYMVTVELATPVAVGGAYAKAVVDPHDPVRVVLRPGRRVLGQILGVDGKPAQGACSLYWSGTNTLWGRVTYLGASLAYDRATDDTGRVALIVPLEGTVRVVARVPAVGTRSFVIAQGDTAESISLPMRSLDGCVAHGRVVDLRGKPIGDATVLVAFKARKHSRVIHDLQAITRTDADGRWRLDGLPKGFVVGISVVAPGYGACGKKQFAAPMDGDHPWVCDLVVVRGASVEGRVVDETGAPVAQATVTVTAGRPGMAQFMPFNTTTDADGHYRVDGLPLTPGSVLAHTPSYGHGMARATVPFRELKPGEVLRADIALVRGLSLHGVVVAADGSPVDGARVTTHIHAGRRGPFAMGAGATGKDGGFVIEGLPAEGRASVTVIASGYGRVTQSIVWPRPTDGRAVQITLPPAISVQGRLVDRDGLPLAGLPLFIEGGGGPQPAAEAASTRSDGSFELWIMAGGSHRILVGTRWAPLLTRVLDLTPGQPIGDLVLPRSAKDRLRGQLVDEEGRPLVGAAVDVRSKAQSALALNTSTDAHGRFEATHIPGGTYSVFVHGSHTVAAELEPGEEEHRVVVQRGGRRIVEGRLLTPAGSPVNAGYLHIVRGDSRSTVGRTFAHVLGGRFRFVLPEGESDRLVFTPMQLSDPLGQPVNALIDPIILEALPEGELALQLPAAHEVRGRVVDGEGQGVFGLQVTLMARDRPGPGTAIAQAMLRAWSDAEGYFRFVGVRNAPVTVTIQHSNDWILPPKPLAADPGDDDLVLTVRRWKRIAGIVRDSEGKPLVGARVRLWWPTPGQPRGQSAHALSTEGGVFLFARVLPDKIFTLRVDPPNQQPLGDVPVVTKDVEPGDEGVDVALTAGLTIEGTVQDREGQPIAGCFVYAKSLRAGEGVTLLWKHNRQTKTDEHGRYRLLGFEKGASCRLDFAMPPGSDPTYFAEHRKKIPASAHDVNVRLERGLRISGLVEGVDPKLLRGIRLTAASVVHQPSRYRSAYTSFDGKVATFSIGPLRAGVCRLTFARNRRADVLFPGEIVVKAGVSDLRIRATTPLTLAGRLRDAHPERFTIQYWDAQGRKQSTRAKPDGSFSFSRLRDDPGVLYIHANGERRSYLREGVRPSQGPLDIELAEGSPIHGRIVELPSKVSRGTVTAVRGPVRVQGVVAEDGLFHLPPLPAGSWALEFRARRPRGGTYKGPKTVDAGERFAIVTWKP